VIDWPQTDCGLTADLRGIVASTCYGICGPIADRFFFRVSHADRFQVVFGGSSRA